MAVLAVAVLTVGVVAAYGALGGQDTATGTGALAAENGGNFNTADGFLALTANTIGTGNTAVGYVAMLSNTTGGYNTATGNGVLGSNTSGTENTADGLNALAGNTTGSQNAGLGSGAGNAAHQNTTGSNNTFLGYRATPGIDAEIDNATAVGANASVSQSDSLVLGAPNVNVGIQNTAPASRLQVGPSNTTTYADYVQVPIVDTTIHRRATTATTPPWSAGSSSRTSARRARSSGSAPGPAPGRRSQPPRSSRLETGALEGSTLCFWIPTGLRRSSNGLRPVSRTTRGVGCGIADVRSHDRVVDGRG